MWYTVPHKEKWKIWCFRLFTALCGSVYHIWPKNISSPWRRFHGQKRFFKYLQHSYSLIYLYPKVWNDFLAKEISFFTEEIRTKMDYFYSKYNSVVVSILRKSHWRLFLDQKWYSRNILIPSNHYPKVLSLSPFVGLRGISTKSTYIPQTS